MRRRPNTKILYIPTYADLEEDTEHIITNLEHNNKKQVLTIKEVHRNTLLKESNINSVKDEGAALKEKLKKALYGDPDLKMCMTDKSTEKVVKKINTKEDITIDAGWRRAEKRVNIDLNDDNPFRDLENF